MVWGLPSPELEFDLDVDFNLLLHLMAIKEASLMKDQHFKAHPTQLDSFFAGAASTGLQCDRSRRASPTESVS